MAFADLNALEFFGKQGFVEVETSSQQYNDLLRVVERFDESLLMAINLPNFTVTAKIQIIDKPHRELVRLFDSSIPNEFWILNDEKKKLTDTINDFKGAMVAFDSSIAVHRYKREIKKKGS